MKYDAVVIGAGHNGLTCAAYLAQAGRKTLVLEQRDIVGGCAVTEEIDSQLAPGCRVSTASYIASMLRPEVIRDLKLASYGLQMVACSPTVQTALPDGRVVSWWSDKERMKAGMREFAPDDIVRFFQIEDELHRLAAYLQPFFLESPPDPDKRGIAKFVEMFRVGRRFRKIRGRETAALLQFLTGSLGDFLDHNFKSEALKRLVLSNSLYGKHGGPYQPGTAMGLLFHLLSGGEEEKQGFAGHVIGGMGAITKAMAASCRDAGVEIRTSCAVQSINQAHGKAQGVTLADGSVVDAKLVVSNADPKRTFLKLLSAGDLDAEFRREVEGIKMDGPCGKVNLVLCEEPRVTGMPTSHSKPERSLFTLAPSLQEAEDIYNQAARGDIPDELWVDCVLASNVDPGLATEGKHVLTCFVQYLPYKPKNSSWEFEREKLGDKVVETIGRYAPNMPSSVVARKVYTPYDLEKTFGITEGNIFHGDINMGQLFFMRPLPGWSQYRTPIDGLYLCGAGTHPGGGVTGAPGYNAAKQILRDKTR
ncbi:MAG: NAD(P)/FAD-dependent oxidoreductase [Proteobacteria bacterium]|nr:NAD(P)/FAD-dependent oxidoreductase [Pseudomonadota bacterium]MDA0992587.1 NAD(P)/FAD-dependent oxidoreductase [Pseudomonadota bacterium]